jgi:hypothetical protein
VLFCSFDQCGRSRSTRSPAPCSTRSETDDDADDDAGDDPDDDAPEHG